ncbi:MAG: hypothetical protein PHG00_12570 [Methylococcales bacterium]|nr:hypothetical protein [Methylococcales bacterium]
MLVTGYHEETASAIAKAQMIGVYTYMYKPFEIDDLTNVIEEIRLKKLQNLLAAS